MIKSISILLTLILPIFGQLPNLNAIPNQLPNNLYEFAATSTDKQLYIAGGLLNNVFYPDILTYFEGQWIKVGSLKNISSIFLKYYQAPNVLRAINIKNSLIIFSGYDDSLNSKINIFNISSGFTEVISTKNHIDMTYLDENNLLVYISSQHIYMMNISTYKTTNITIQTNIICRFVNSFSSKNLIVFAGGEKTSESPGHTLGIVIFDIFTSLFEDIILDNNDKSIHGTIGLSVYEDYELCVVFSLTKIYIYDLKTKSISFSLIPTPVERYSTPKKIYSGLIFIVGGIPQTNDPYTNQQVTGLVQIYNIFTKTWSINYLIDTAFNTIAINTKIYSNNEILLILGGSQGSNGPYLNDVNFFTYCPERTYLSTDYSKCLTCPEEYYCPAGSISGFNGYFLCNAGYYCPQGSYQQTACPAGTYNSYSGQISENNCLSCPAGTFNIFTGQTSITNCLQCSQGTICNEKSAIPFNCPANYYCPNPTQQIPCPIGTFFNGESATNISSCTPCQKGSFCSGNGLNAIPCEAGSYSDKQGNSNCNDCPPGHSCSYGASTPEPCPKNTYSPKGASACTPCENEEFTLGIGSSSCMTCPASKFSFDGWWCMSIYEKIIFLVIWITSIISSLFSVWKLNKYIKQRKQKIIEYGYRPSIKTFLFIEKMPKSNYNMSVIVEEKPMLENDELKKIYTIVDKLQAKMDLIESNSRS